MSLAIFFSFMIRMLYATSEKHEGYIAITTLDSKYPLKSILTFIREVVETDEKLKYLRSLPEDELYKYLVQ